MLNPGIFLKFDLIFVAGEKSKGVKLIKVFNLVSALILFTHDYANAQDSSINPEPLTLGIIADCQYADKPTLGVRHYSMSDEKLKLCVDNFNTMHLDHVFHLGDFIDQERKSFEMVLPIIKQLNAEFTLVLGNHDFSVTEELKEKVPQIMGLKDRYFTLGIRGWKFIILDGNDVSLFAWPKESQEHNKAQEIHQRKYMNQPTYNGALGKDQMVWLKNQLEQAENQAEKVILLCHFPILPADAHVLWNSAEVLELISRYKCVKAWLNGHNHAGDYAEYQGIHFVTFKGMVDTQENSYATVHLQQNQLSVTGFGRETDMVLMLKTDN